MATYGRVKIGRLTLREDRIVTESVDPSNVRTIQLSGQESMGTVTSYPLSQINQKREDFIFMDGQVVPVIFDRKPNYNGYYVVANVSGSIENHDGVTAIFPWTASLTRVGTDKQTDFESRLSGALTRTNAFSVVGQKGHAPSIGHIGYQVGSTIPSFTTRSTADGSVIFYRSLAVGVNPRWACDVANYEKGRSRFIDSALYERTGLDPSVIPTGWELNNAMVRIKPLVSGGVFEISHWTGGAWHAKNWDVTLAAASIGTFDYCTVLKNSYESVAIRLVKSLTPGRCTVDLTLRRGHRFVEMYIQHDFSTTIKIVRSTAELGVRPGAAGYVTANANDADTNKYILGSALAYVEDTTNGGISKASTTTLDAFVGVVAGGTGAATGDAAVDVYAQYIGVPSELIRGIRR